MKTNFIVARLGNNDYGFTVKKALEDYVYEMGSDDLDPKAIKGYIIAFVLGKEMKQNAFYGRDYFLDLKNTIRYLEGELKVSLEKNAPTGDCDGGSAYFDINLGQSWTY